MTNDTERLMKAAAAGDKDAQDALLVLCRPYLLDVLIAELGADREAAEEILQNALAVAWSKRASIEWRTFEEFRGLLKVIAIGAVSDWRKHARRERRDVRREVGGAPEVLVNVQGQGDSPSRQARRRERSEKLEEAIDALLTEKEAAAVRLRFLKEKSVRETAEALGLSEGYVKNLCSTALDKLEAMGRASNYFSE